MDKNKAYHVLMGLRNNHSVDRYSRWLQISIIILVVGCILVVINRYFVLFALVGFGMSVFFLMCLYNAWWNRREDVQQIQKLDEMVD